MHPGVSLHPQAKGTEAVSMSVLFHFLEKVAQSALISAGLTLPELQWASAPSAQRFGELVLFPRG